MARSRAQLTTASLNARAIPTQRGQALLVSLLLLLLLAVLVAIVVRHARVDLEFRSIVKERDQALDAAEAGITYALWRLERGDWLERQRPLAFEGKHAKRGGFLVRVTDVAHEAALRVHAEGWSKLGGVRRRVTVLVSNPSELMQHVRQVYHFDSAARQLQERHVLELGAGGEAVNGVVEEIFTVPGSRRIVLGAVSEPSFHSVVIASDAVISSAGHQFRRAGVAAAEDIRPPPGLLSLPGLQKAGQYVIDYATGELTFHPDDVGQHVFVFYEYYHRVPGPPPPFAFGLPYAPVAELTDVVYSPLTGRVFRRDPVLPTVRDHYFLDYGTGLTTFSEQDAGLPLGMVYSFLGARYTGPLHVNGDLHLDRNVLFYLFATRGDSVTATGKVRYSPQARPHVLFESRRTVNPILKESSLLREKAELHYPPDLNMVYYRDVADPERGGDGLYINNPAHRQDPEDVLQEWQLVRPGQRYRAPAVPIDLNRIRVPPNGVIYAEGNVSVEGKLPRRTRLTVVSGGIIYIEGNLQRQDEESSLALLARDHVCLNASVFAPERKQIAQRRIQGFYVNALVYAQRGTFAVIPALGEHRQLIVYGAVNENFPYPPAEWAEAFDAVEFIYDPLLRRPECRPPHLVSVLLWEEGAPAAASIQEEEPTTSAEEAER